VVKRVREIAGIGMEVVQFQVGITLYTNFKLNLLFTDTYKTIAFLNINQNETPSTIIEPSPNYKFSTQSIACHPVTLILIPLFMKC
jgi:hypothetical protein